MGKWYKGVVSLDPDKMWSLSLNEKYWVSEDGRIINAKTGFELSPTDSKDGYKIISKESTGQRNVHRIVYESFIGEIPEGLCINHIDGVKSNNHISNLEVCTYSENTIHAYKTGLAKGKSGEENAMAKLSEDEFLNIYDLFLKGYDNRQVSKIHNVHDRYVSLIRHGKRWSYLFEREGMVETESSGNLPYSLPKCMYILNFCKTSKLMNKEIADIFDLDRSTISRIKSKNTWKCLFKHCELQIGE